MKSEARVQTKQFRTGDFVCAVHKREVVVGGTRGLVSVANLSRHEANANGRNAGSISLTRDEVAITISILKHALDEMADCRIELDMARAMTHLKSG